VNIGQRIKELRQGRLSQLELARRAGVSKDIVSKLEQGQRRTASLDTLHKLAYALDVDIAELFPTRQAMPETLALRQAVTRWTTDAEPKSLSDLRAVCDDAWRAYWANRWDDLMSALPDLLDAARATPGADVVLSEAYCIAGSALVLQQQVDLALLAMERGIAATERSGEELRHSAMIGSLSWVLQHQTGNNEEAQRIAIAEAERLEPDMGRAAPERLSVWGGLLTSAAIAAARAGRGDKADDLLATASEAAQRLGGMRVDYQVDFGPERITMQLVDSAVVTGRPGRGLKIAQLMPRDGALRPAHKARHLADVAYAYMDLGKDAKATDTLWRIHQTAPRWIKNQTFPKVIARELLERERTVRTPRLRELASVMGLQF
jgi:transcriptional regulator with XRE-family HTH domain